MVVVEVAVVVFELAVKVAHCTARAAAFSAWLSKTPTREAMK